MDFSEEQFSKVLGVDPFMDVFLEADRQDLPDFFIVDEFDVAVHQVCGHFGVGEVAIGCLSHQHFVEDDPDSPDIALVRILILLIGLGTHVSRRSHIIADLRLPLSHELAKPEISDFGFSLRKEDVGCFQIPMNDVLVLYQNIAFHYVPGDLEGGKFSQLPFALDEVEEVAVLTEFGDDVDIVFSHEDINSLKDVRVPQRLESIDLIVEEILLYFILHFGQFDDFDGDSLVVRVSGHFIDAFVNMRAEPRADEVMRVIDKILDFLDQPIALSEVRLDIFDRLLHSKLISGNYIPSTFIIATSIPS